MSVETLPPDERCTPIEATMRIELAAMHESLILPLRLCGAEIVKEFGAKIQEACGQDDVLEFDTETARQFVQGELTHTATRVWHSQREASLKMVDHRDFPGNSKHLPLILSARTYQRELGSNDSRLRSELKSIQDDAKKTAVSTLRNEVGNSEPQVPAEVDDISNIASYEMTSLAEQQSQMVTDAFAELRELLLHNPEAYPALVQQQASWITRFAFGKEKIPSEEPVPVPTINKKDLSTAIIKVKTAVARARELFRTMPDTKVAEFSGCVQEATTSIARGYFTDLQMQAIDALNIRLRNEYDLCASKASTLLVSGTEAKPPKRRRSCDTEASNECDGTIDLTTANPETTEPMVETDIGTLTSPFGWLAADTPVNFQHVMTAGGEIVFCEAMSPKHRRISKIVRQEGASNGKKFPNVSNRIKVAEAEGNAIKHPFIKSTKGCEVDDHSLLYYKINGPDGVRAYYIRTTIKAYPAIAELASTHGISAQTLLIILVGETDKNNQVELFTGFGVSRRSLRGKGVR